MRWSRYEKLVQLFWAAALYISPPLLYSSCGLNPLDVVGFSSPLFLLYSLCGFKALSDSRVSPLSCLFLSVNLLSYILYIQNRSILMELKRCSLFYSFRSFQIHHIWLKQFNSTWFFLTLDPIECIIWARRNRERGGGGWGCVSLFFYHREKVDQPESTTKKMRKRAKLYVLFKDNVRNSTSSSCNTIYPHPRTMLVFLGFQLLKEHATKALKCQKTHICQVHQKYGRWVYFLDNCMWRRCIGSLRWMPSPRDCLTTLKATFGST